MGGGARRVCLSVCRVFYILTSLTLGNIIETMALDTIVAIVIPLVTPLTSLLSMWLAERLWIFSVGLLQRVQPFSLLLHLVIIIIMIIIMNKKKTLDLKSQSTEPRTLPVVSGPNCSPTLFERYRKKSLVNSFSPSFIEVSFFKNWILPSWKKKRSNKDFLFHSQVTSGLSFWYAINFTSYKT